MKNGWGKLRLISAVLLGLFAMGGLSTCKHEPPYLDTTTTNTGVDTICFERDILPLFKTNCAKSGCHDSITQEENMMLNSYNGIRYSKDKGVVPGDPSKSKLIKEIDNGKMNGPTSGYGNLSADQVALIKRWIKEGAVNGSNCRSLCDSGIYTYSKGVFPIYKKYCNSCHSAGAAPYSGGSVVLETYADMKAAVDNGKLWSSLNRTINWMPKGASRLSTCEMAQIRKWIAAGAPNN